VGRSRGASEGLDVVLVEDVAPGGQAGTSSRIENYLSDKTVRNYVTSIVNKLQAEDRAQVAVRAIRAGLTAQPPT
jgi:hypothetical protein